jgi:hypothetical protein
LGNSEETVVALCALLSGIVREVLAQDMAREAGVPDAEMKRVTRAVVAHWKRSRASNPLSRMF